MAKSGKLMWTQTQREVAQLIQEGKTYSEIIDAGHSNNMFTRVAAALKRGEAPPVLEETGEKTDTNKKKQDGKSGTAGRPLELGKIVVTPENWGINQRGAILILDTYTKAKNDPGLKYEGTVGDFLCDVMQMWRVLMGYEEVNYDGEHTESSGGGGVEENGAEDIEKELIESAA